MLLAAGILGATVMPHVIYLHSALTQNRIIARTPEQKRRIFRYELLDILIAMGIAGLVNAAMLMMAAATFWKSGVEITAESDIILEAFRTLTPLLGGAASIIFAISLLASGLSSSTVGTMAGQVIMQGFIHRQIPIWLRRLITMLPALVVIAFGIDATRALVLSQVVLSFGIPFALVPLVLFTRRRDLMGELVNRPLTTLAAGGRRNPDHQSQPVSALPDVPRLSAGGRSHGQANRGGRMTRSWSPSTVHRRLRRSCPRRRCWRGACPREVELLHVLERNAPDRVHGERHLTSESDAASYLQGIADQLAAEGVPVSWHVHLVRVGDIPLSIASHAAECGASLILLSAHGAGSPRSWLTGAVAQGVIRHAAPPVLLLRSGPKRSVAVRPARSGGGPGHGAAGGSGAAPRAAAGPVTRDPAAAVDGHSDRGDDPG